MARSERLGEKVFCGSVAALQDCAAWTLTNNRLGGEVNVCHRALADRIAKDRAADVGGELECFHFGDLVSGFSFFLESRLADWRQNASYFFSISKIFSSS